MRQFWWEDAWAAFALISDGNIFLVLYFTVNQPDPPVFCLANIWDDTFDSNSE